MKLYRSDYWSPTLLPLLMIARRSSSPLWAMQVRAIRKWVALAEMIFVLIITASLWVPVNMLAVMLIAAGCVVASPFVFPMDLLAGWLTKSGRLTDILTTRLSSIDYFSIGMYCALHTFLTFLFGVALYVVVVVGYRLDGLDWYQECIRSFLLSSWSTGCLLLFFSLGVATYWACMLRTWFLILLGVFSVMLMNVLPVLLFDRFPTDAESSFGE